jgi:3-phenylpropionate/cinnamic acid dioxygenase small subunit
VTFRPDKEQYMDIETISAHMEIDSLLTRYATAIDGHDWDLLDTVFAPDAHLDYRSAGGIAGDYPQVKKWLAEVLPAVFEVTQHLVANRDIRIDGDRATARSMIFNPNRYRVNGEVRHFICGGYYRDELRRLPQGWRIVRRVEDLQWWENQMPGLPDVPPPVEAE